MAKTSADYLKLTKDYPLISEQMTKKRLETILKSLSDVLGQDIAGDIVEFGCYSGTTSLFLKRMMNLYAADKKLHVYDSFSGLPDKTIKDASVVGSDFKAGELKASKRELVRNFRKAGLELPQIHKGWFSQLKDKDVPQQICFAFLDGDFYNSIMDSLTLVWPRLSENGLMVVDDYERSGLPGVSRAINEFFQNQPLSIIHKNNLALIKKPKG